jgi:hypothetical protein
MVQFSPELRDDVASGDITVSFRLWRRPKVKVGGRYPVGPVRIEVDSVELVPFSSVTRADVRLSGERDRESLRRRAAHAAPSMTTRLSIGSSSTSSRRTGTQ